jgi:calcium/calmodulin-dependent protein kinase I
MPGILDRFRKREDDKKQAKQNEPQNRIFNLNDSNIHDHYTIKHFLGKGSFSSVRLGTRKDKKPVAVKIIEKNNIDIKVASLKTEVTILMNVEHPNIVSLLDVFEDNDRVYLIMELMNGGELFDRICNDFPNGYSEKQSSVLIKKIIEAVKYLHDKGIIHRDLKPENLLFSSPDKYDAEIKISDFGLAKIWSGDMLVKTACGSPNYVAPEVLLNDMHGYSFACDMWSVGVVLYVLLCGFCPFFDECTPALFASITSGNYSFPSPPWDSISEDAKDLVRRLLLVDPNKRYTPEQALNHQWIVNNTMDQTIPDITENLKNLNVGRSQGSFEQ